MRNFLIATQSRTKPTSVSIAAMIALMTGCPFNRNKQTYRTTKHEPFGDRQCSKAEEVVQKDPGQEDGEARPACRFHSPTADRALANFTGGFPAMVIGSPSRDRICCRNCISLTGVETPRRKLVGKCPCSATLLLPLKKFRGHVELA